MEHPVLDKMTEAWLSKRTVHWKDVLGDSYEDWYYECTCPSCSESMGCAMERFYEECGLTWNPKPYHRLPAGYLSAHVASNTQRVVDMGDIHTLEERNNALSRWAQRLRGENPDADTEPRFQWHTDELIPNTLPYTQVFRTNNQEGEDQ